MALKGKTPKYSRGQRVYSKTWGSNATVVASDNTRSFRTVFYIIRLDGATKDSYNIPEHLLAPPR
ncbi:hypothetical protein SEA_PHREDRICK_188 [Streptomyces phage Phredrick]|nr:hypothetical protein SEA_PHREDRICK_188 [Streptomyces phage Phredrick]